MVVAGSGSTRPAAPLDPGGAKIPRNADPAPAAPPTYKDLVGKLKKAPEVKPFSNPVTPSRPRERSPPRGDRRPLGEQRRPKKESAGLFPGGDGREEALSRRSKTIPKASGPQEFYIGDRGEKRKASEPPDDRRRAPNQRQLDAKTAPRPAPVKRKATSGPADSQAKRKQPPGPPIGDRKIGKPRKARSSK